MQEYLLELTNFHTNLIDSKLLVDISKISVIETTVYENLIVCNIQVEGIIYTVKESYSYIKNKINEINQLNKI